MTTLQRLVANLFDIPVVETTPQTDADLLEAMLDRAGVVCTRDSKQSKIGAPPGSFIIWTEQPPGWLNARSWYVVYHFWPDERLMGMQVSE